MFVLLISTVLSSSREHLFGDLVAAAEHPHADVVVHDRGPLLDHVLLQQVHQEVDFRLRPLPVFARQAIERELLDLEPGTFFGGAADRIDAALVAGDAGQVLPLGPAAVAVHDDRDVPRAALGRNFQRRRCDVSGHRASHLANDNRLVAFGADGHHSRSAARPAR